MKVYIATKFENKELFLQASKELNEICHEVAYDWTTHKPIKHYVENSDIASVYSNNELEGIKNCDVFIYVTYEKGHTLHMEFGAALILSKTIGKPKLIYAVGEFNDQSPWFFNQLVRRKDTIQEVT